MANNNEFNAWKAAGTVPSNSRAYYGQIIFDCVAMVFPGEKGSKSKPVVYDPQIHTNAQPFVQITAKLDPLPEMQLSNETSSRWPNYSADWVKITMPSIKKLGFVDTDGSCDIVKFNNSWVKFRFVPGFTKNKDPEKPNYKTMDFLAVYKNEAECRKAYQEENASNVQPGFSHTEPVQSQSNEAVASALKFVESIAENAMRKGDDIDVAVDNFLEQNAAVCAGLKIDSPEIQALLKKYDENPPF